MSYILALDQGTTSSRAIIFNEEGLIETIAQNEFQQFYPKPGWVEHDPREIWSTQAGVAAEAISKVGASSREIAGIGITNQRETTVVWDRRTGEPIYNAIVWQDRRTAEFCDSLKEAGHVDLFQEKTGLVIDSYFSGTKVRWILENVEGAREKAEAGHLAFGTVDSWLVWKLTNGELHITDVSNASRTLMYNIREEKWDDELLDILDVPHSVLPDVRPSSEVYGETAGDIFSTPVPIAGIAGDQQSALFGQVCTQQGMGKNTYGTGAFMLMNTGDTPVKSENDLLTTIAWKLGDEPTQYALEGSIFIAGAVVQWLRDEMRMIRSAEDVEYLAQKVDSTDGVYLVPAFAGLGAPHWDQYARGTIVGITRGTNESHIARAALESIAMQSVDVIRAQEADSGIPLKELRVDGGATANNLLMQMQANLLGVPVVRPEVTETTALGAAYLAGLAVGFYESVEDISKQWKVDARFEPDMERSEAERKMKQWGRAVKRSMNWAKEE
ncbi:MAG: glycerol kinase GlpK [Longimonas sp.]|uniref:glycerol kinase GlpK n=1 Tax=Longimonas sp. TaxID=2039626 RepID=UPI003357282A